jgi:hypothetical protein
MQRDYVALLADNLSRLDEAVRWLKRSQEICHSIDVAGDLSKQDFDARGVLGRAEKTRTYGEKLLGAR